MQDVVSLKSSLYSREYAEACSEWRDPTPQLGVRKTQLRRTSQRRRLVSDIVPYLTDSKIETITSGTDSDVFNHNTNRPGNIVRYVFS